MTTTNPITGRADATVQVPHFGKAPATRADQLVPGDRVRHTGGAESEVVDAEFTASGASVDVTLRGAGGEERVRRYRSATMVALAYDRLLTEAREDTPSEPAEGPSEPLGDAPRAEVPETAPEREGAPRRKPRSKDVAAEAAGVTVTARQLEFLRVMADESSLGSPDGGWWVDCVIDAGGYNGMSAGAMVSTLREKGLIRVGTELRDNPATGRASKAKAISLTDLGHALWAELGL